MRMFVITLAVLLAVTPLAFAGVGETIDKFMESEFIIGLGLKFEKSLPSYLGEEDMSYIFRDKRRESYTVEAGVDKNGNILTLTFIYFEGRGGASQRLDIEIVTDFVYEALNQVESRFELRHIVSMLLRKVSVSDTYNASKHLQGYWIIGSYNPDFKKWEVIVRKVRQKKE